MALTKKFENSDQFLAPLCLVLRLEEEVSVTIKVRKWESILTLLKFVIIAHVVYGVCAVCVCHTVCVGNKN